MRTNNKSFSRTTIAEKHVAWYLYNFVKSYLYLLSSGQCVDSDVDVVSLTGVSEPYSRRPKSLSVSDDMSGRYVRVSDAILIGSLRFRGGLYQVSVSFEISHRDEVDYFVYILGIHHDKHRNPS